MRRTVAVAGVVLGIAVVTVMGLSVATGPSTSPVVAEEATDAERQQFVRLEGYESGVWPWLSPSRSFRQRSPINVLVRGDADTVIRILRSGTETQWERTPPDQQEIREDDLSVEDIRLNGSEIRWGTTGGGTRYAYVHDGETGTWVRETQHLHDGSYYGHRVHMRLYESPHPDEEWVAIQAHSEHFDWFTLRHAVDGVQAAQVHVETDLMNHPAVAVEDVRRRYLGNGSVSDSDGWATVVLLAVLPLLGGSAVLDRIWRTRLTSVDRRRVRALRDRLSLRQGTLAAAILGLFLGVRVAGLVLERSGVDLTMYQIAGLLYPFVAIGIPLATYLLARGIERRMDAAVTAAAALAAAVLLDYAYVGVEVIPIDILLHRVGVILALGLLAGGAAHSATRDTRLNELAIAGITLWILLLGATLFEVV